MGKQRRPLHVGTVAKGFPRLKQKAIPLSGANDSSDLARDVRDS